MGWNVDWEPSARATADDAAAYAQFLTAFADAMHAENMELSVDIATWNPIWYESVSERACVCVCACVSACVYVLVCVLR